MARLRQGERDPYTYFVTQTKAEAEEDVLIHTKPAGLYACVYLRGDYCDAEEGFARLLDGMEELLTCIAIGIADYRLEA